jgi:hypothetical protein
MKYAVEMSSGAMLYIPGSTKICSGIQKLIGGIYRHTESMLISQTYFYFLKIRNVG